MRFLVVLVVFITNFRLCYGWFYEGYALYNLYPHNVKHVKYLVNVSSHKSKEVLPVSHPVLLGKRFQILVKNTAMNNFISKIRELDIKAHKLTDDVHDLFRSQLAKQGVDEDQWNMIPNLDQVYIWLKEKSVKNPNLTKLESIGKSFEKRDIYVFQISTTPKLRNNRLKVIIESGIYGNEWMGTMFCMYFINDLLKTTDKNLLRLREKFDWYFIPILNPDGYDYSQKKDPLWRKNRRILKGNMYGVNLNRNFDYKFGKFDSSKNPDHMLYSGPSPFSEPESKALRDFMFRERDMLAFYFSLQGSGQKMLIPYSDIRKHVSNYHEVKGYALQAATRIGNFSGRKYFVGNAHDAFGMQISGDSTSWVKKTYYVPYVLTVFFREDARRGIAVPNNYTLIALQEMKLVILGVIKASPKRLRGHMLSNTFLTNGYSHLIAFLASIWYLFK